MLLQSLPIVSHTLQDAEMQLKASKVKAEPKDDAPGANSMGAVTDPIPSTANVFWTNPKS